MTIICTGCYKSAELPEIWQVSTCPERLSSADCSEAAAVKLIFVVPPSCALPNLGVSVLISFAGSSWAWVWKHRLTSTGCSNTTASVSSWSQLMAVCSAAPSDVHPPNTRVSRALGRAIPWPGGQCHVFITSQDMSDLAADGVLSGRPALVRGAGYSLRILTAGSAQRTPRHFNGSQGKQKGGA
ncbi:hypothetical protein RRG08_046945 [Elysia crispata]|uniref:Uncharacterized protein n=1 Tax=Elysia crispata TaxID=231223 RepID=A0AAE1DU49_9GAST|nr:hypothetical protein RRG08_046945 [Elysia crispata]